MSEPHEQEQRPAEQRPAERDSGRPAVPSSRRSYGLTVLLGLAGAALAAVGGARTWTSGHAFAAGIRVEAGVKGSEAAPLVGALGLVALASWGVILVTRGRVRRVVAVVGLVASLGALASALLGLGSAPGDLLTALKDKGAVTGQPVTAMTAWPYLALLGAVLAAATFVVATVKAPGWPAMGSRYDAPGARPSAVESEQDMWRALDQGHDPTS